jgi:septum formation protein
MKTKQYRPLFSLSQPLVLASGSPRRQLFLQEWGLDFSVHVPSIDEPLPMQGEAPAAYALRAALAKGRAVAASHPHSIVLAADTIVALGRSILGKPPHAAAALAMLQQLVGKTHQVITAVCLSLPQGQGLPQEQSFTCSCDVTFAPWSSPVLAAYVRTGEPMDKAGAYAIQGQGAFLVSSIHGSWSTVVGLPVTEIAQRLEAAGLLHPAAKSPAA